MADGCTVLDTSPTVEVADGPGTLGHEGVEHHGQAQHWRETIAGWSGAHVVALTPAAS